MDPNGPSTGSKTPGETRPELAATLRRIEARLERLEQAFEPIAQATSAAPALTSTAVDVLDDWAKPHGDLDTRLPTLSELLERRTRPEALAHNHRSASACMLSGPTACQTRTGAACCKGAFEDSGEFNGDQSIFR